jgi:hypothetical protein
LRIEDTAWERRGTKQLFLSALPAGASAGACQAERAEAAGLKTTCEPSSNEFATHA